MRLLWLFLIFFCITKSLLIAQNKPLPLIAVSIPPQEEILKELAGDLIQTFTLVNYKTNPHNYTPLPNQIRDMANADAFFTIGLEFEERWIPNFRTQNRGLKVIATDRGIAKLSYSQRPNYNYYDYYNYDYNKNYPPRYNARERQERANMPNDPEIYWENFDRDSYPKHRPNERPNHSSRPPYDRPPYNPDYTPRPQYPYPQDRDYYNYNEDTHIWLSVSNYEAIAQNSLNALISLLPSQEILLRNNFEKLRAKIKDTHLAIKSALINVPKDAKFMIYHPSLAYFAKEYALLQIPIEARGRPPIASELDFIINTALRDNVSTIIDQPEFQQRAVQIIAEELRAKTIIFSSLQTPWSSNLITLAKELSNSLNL